MPYMVHPDIDGHIEVGARAATVHAKSGWTEVDLVDLPKTELLAKAKQSGTPTKKSAPKAEIAKAITSIKPEEG